MRYFLGLLTFIAFIILVVVVVVHHGSNTGSGTSSGIKTVHLTDYIDKNSEVQLTTDGHINSEEEHRAIQINVTPNSREAIVFRGYNQQVLKQESLPNSKAAYDAFLRSLALLNFTKEKRGVRQTDERGVCPTGKRYIYELLEDNKDVTRLWSTSCSSSQGTFAGTPSTVQTLFQNQIPDYNKFVIDVQL